ncbi:hypothetical protein [Citrobacter portucalensis]|uniref:hypothetical protein n=2 Tax=Citrobacter freundii complex TaxID=1344959 RepID=UPI0012997A3A|nr:hypothetical protein [Citrobacter portucalensis]MRF60478.1 hypothetical protein [Citrobacter portucalensis]
MSISYKEYLHCYMLATENEISIDELLIAGMKNRMPAMPRISKWVYSIYKLWAVYILLMIFFILGGFILYPILKFIIAVCGKIKTKKRHLTNKNGIYYFSFSEIGTEQVITYFKKNRSNENELNIIAPLSCKSKHNDTVISLYEVVSYYEIFKSMLLSISTFLYFFKSVNHLKWVLQIYTAPSWFLVAIALNKIQGEIVSSEHYDRWAVLIDVISGKKKNRYTLVQHGSLKALDSNAYLAFQIPYKLKHVGKIVVFDELEYKFFSDKILDPSLTEIIEVEYSKPELSLSQVTSSQLTLLFIGHSLCEKEQLRICSQINRKINNCTIYYKEHPKARASLEVRNFNFNFITDDRFFPDVDIVISYPSTLAYQYEEKGIPVLFHGLHVVHSDEVDEIVAKVILNWGKYEESKL